MDTQNTLDKISKNKPSAAIQDKLYAANRKGTALNILNELDTKYAIKSEYDSYSVTFMKSFLSTQAILISKAMYLGIDFDKNEYFLLDLQLGEEYRK